MGNAESDFATSSMNGMTTAMDTETTGKDT